MKATRTLLTGFLLVAAFLLSFGALRHRALTAGIIHGDLGLPFGLFDARLSAHTIAGVWALTLDGLTAVGVLGVRDKAERDWRSWVALGLGLGLSLWFQTVGYLTWEARGMAAVPPLALAMAVWIFEVPRSRPVVIAEPVGPVRAASGPGEDPGPTVPVPATRHGPPAGSSGHPAPRPTTKSGPVRTKSVVGPISGTDRAKVAAWRAETPPRSARWIATQLGLKGGQGREQVARLIEDLRAAPVGGPGPNGDGGS